MTLQKHLRTLTGAQRKKLANKAKTSVAYLYQLAGKHRMAGVELAKRIDKATQGIVTKKSLRPDIW